MQNTKSNSANVGILCAGFCAIAGFTYGALAGTHFPASPALITTMAFFNALDWSLLLILVCSVAKRDFKSAEGAAIAFLISLALSTIVIFGSVPSLLETSQTYDTSGGS